MNCKKHGKVAVKHYKVKILGVLSDCIRCFFCWHQDQELPSRKPKVKKGKQEENLIQLYKQSNK